MLVIELQFEQTKLNKGLENSKKFYFNVYFCLRMTNWNLLISTLTLWNLIAPEFSGYKSCGLFILNNC